MAFTSSATESLIAFTFVIYSLQLCENRQSVSATNDRCERGENVLNAARLLQHDDKFILDPADHILQHSNCLRDRVLGRCPQERVGDGLQKRRDASRLTASSDVVEHFGFVRQIRRPGSETLLVCYKSLVCLDCGIRVSVLFEHALHESTQREVSCTHRVHLGNRRSVSTW